MSHYAKVEHGIVTEVIVADSSVIPLFPGKWVQTSYNTRNGIHYDENGDPSGKPGLRYTYAAIGFEYLEEHDIFVAPRPYKSWVFNMEQKVFLPPVPYPNDGKSYKWNEENVGWTLIESS